MLKKIISGGDTRKTRLHTEDDHFIGLGRAIVETPLVVAQKTIAAISGRRPIAPWWPLAAISAVESVLNKDMRAIEFGSGSSTIWLAQRVKSVLAREHNANWAKITAERITESGLINAQVQHRDGSDYYAISDEEKFDFAVVDGKYRWKCIESLAEHMAPGGIVYFDNSDSDKDLQLYPEFGTTGDHLAQAVVRRLKDDGRLKRVEEYHSMINGELFAGSGMLFEFK